MERGGSPNQEKHPQRDCGLHYSRLRSRSTLWRASFGAFSVEDMVLDGLVPFTGMGFHSIFVVGKPTGIQDVPTFIPTL
jgi:hypothetical protein